MTNKLICSKMTEEWVIEKWHRLPGYYRYNRPAYEWLESDSMKGRWLESTGVYCELYFEYEEDKMLFWMLWGNT